MKTGTDTYKTETLIEIAESRPTAGVLIPAPTGWPILDDRAYYGLAGDIIRSLEPHTEADPIGMLVQLLAAFGNIVGAGAHLLIGAKQHPARLNVVLVGQSSVARKGESWAQVSSLYRQVDEPWAKLCIKSGLSSGEGLVYHVRDGLGEDPGVFDKRLLVVEEELAQALRMKAREGNTLSTVIRQAWDAGDLSFLVKNNPNAATDAHVSIVGHITREELDDVFRREGGVELCNGFANRFLWIAVRRCREIPSPRPLPTSLTEQLVKRLRMAGEHARSLGELKLDAEADAEWEHIYHDLTASQPGTIGKVLDRAAPQVKRLALAYCLLDECTAIGRDHLHAALAVWQYARASATWVFRDQLPAKCRTILKELTAKGAVDQTAIYKLFGNHESTQVKGALELLRHYNLATSTEIPTNGRPRVVWTPAAAGDEHCEKSEERVSGD